MTRSAYVVVLAVFLLGAVGLAGCEQDNEVDLLEAQAPCDTTNARYTTSIRPIFQTHCVVCHSGPSPASGVDWSASADLREFEQFFPGRILQAVRHEQGAPAMPRNAPKLSECNIRLLERWFANGMPE
jgi:mono/diheme cytochrome c family protein